MKCNLTKHFSTNFALLLLTPAWKKTEVSTQAYLVYIIKLQIGNNIFTIPLMEYLTLYIKYKHKLFCYGFVEFIRCLYLSA